MLICCCFSSSLSLVYAVVSQSVVSVQTSPCNLKEILAMWHSVSVCEQVWLFKKNSFTPFDFPFKLLWIIILFALVSLCCAGVVVAVRCIVLTVGVCVCVGCVKKGHNCIVLTSVFHSSRIMDVCAHTDEGVREGSMVGIFVVSKENYDPLYR